MGLKWLFFSQPCTLPFGYENTQLVQDGYQIQSKAIATILIMWDASMNILFIVKVNILVPPLIMLVVEFRMLSIF